LAAPASSRGSAWSQAHPPRALGDEANPNQNASEDEQRAQDENLHPAGKRREFCLLGRILPPQDRPGRSPGTAARQIDGAIAAIDEHAAADGFGLPACRKVRRKAVAGGLTAIADGGKGLNQRGWLAARLAV
jgi:hypothetical protein